jgi:hypothetical protein
MCCTCTCITLAMLCHVLQPSQCTISWLTDTLQVTLNNLGLFSSSVACARTTGCDQTQPLTFTKTVDQGKDV